MTNYNPNSSLSSENGRTTTTTARNSIIPTSLHLAGLALLACNALITRVAAADDNGPSSQQNGGQGGGGDCGGPRDGFTGAEMAGVGVGIGVPFFAASMFAMWLLSREKRRTKAYAALYGPLPKNGEEHGGGQAGVKEHGSVSENGGGEAARGEALGEGQQQQRRSLSSSVSSLSREEERERDAELMAHGEEARQETGVVQK